jgi:ABC-type transport system involved in cytochrome bd biosynthesis fused ATPase/permease subunit
VEGHCQDQQESRGDALFVSPLLFTQIGLSITRTFMGILRAFGFGLFLVVILILMPTVFSELTKTAVIFLQSSQQAFMAAGIVASYAGHIPSSVH